MIVDINKSIRIKSPANDNSNDARKCAICSKPQLENFSPFCSKRCADVDLNRWLTGHYTIPLVENDQSSDAEDS